MRLFRSIFSVALLAVAVALSGSSVGQAFSAPDATLTDYGFSAPKQLSPEMALATYERGLKQQSSELTGYTATSIIDAELPNSAQNAEFELKQHYAAPSLLEFTPLRSTGDKFVRSNVIIRLLQSEVDHVRRGEQSQTAINSENYKFSYRGRTQVNQVTAHVFEVKPRHKHVGLFKGKIFVDASNGYLLRAQGRIVKSPSFFIKKIDFVQDYATVAGFTFPIHIHSEAQTRIVGKAIVDVIQRDYQPETNGGGGALQTAALDDGSN